MHQSWSFDIGALMVLLGDQEETNYRIMHRSVIECWAGAPVAGIQTYLRSFSQLIDADGPEMISPYGCTRKPLRNARLQQAIKSSKLHMNGLCRVFGVRQTATKDGVYKVRSGRLSLYLAIWIVCTWIFYAAILASIYVSKRMTWIGTSNCLSLTFLSIAIRVAETLCLERKELPVSNPDRPGAAVFLGPRNSCLVLEVDHKGSAPWASYGLRLKNADFIKPAELFVRLSAFLLLLYVFITMPNGSTWDQVAFICTNLLGQLNNIVGRSLHTLDYSTALEKKVERASPTRTHVYAFLLRRFGDGAWVDEVNLLPGTGIWQRWRESVIAEMDVDPKILYDSCCERYANEKYPSGKATLIPKEDEAVA